MYITDFLSEVPLPCYDSSVELPKYLIFAMRHQEALFKEYENVNLLSDLSIVWLPLETD